MTEYISVIRKFAFSAVLAAAFLLWTPMPALAEDCYEMCAGCGIVRYGCDECTIESCELQGFGCAMICWWCPGMPEPQCA